MNTVKFVGISVVGLVLGLLGGFLMWLLLWVLPAQAGLTLEWTTQPGEQAQKEVAVWGDPAKGPDDPKAVTFTVPKESSGALVVDATIREAFPLTTYLGVTVRTLGMAQWWTHDDGSYTYIPWTPNPVTVTPDLPTLKSVLADAIDLCLKTSCPTPEQCMAFIRDALKKETK